MVENARTPHILSEDFVSKKLIYKAIFSLILGTSGTQYLTCSDPSHRNQINRPLVISGHGTYDYLRSHMTVTPTHIFIFVPIIPIRQYKYDPNLMFIHFVTQELSSSSSVTGYNNNYSLVHTVTESGQYHRPHRPVSLGHTHEHIHRSLGHPTSTRLGTLGRATLRGYLARTRSQLSAQYT